LCPRPTKALPTASRQGDAGTDEGTNMIKNEPIYKPAAVAKNKHEHKWLYANKGKDVTVKLSNGDEFAGRLQIVRHTTLVLVRENDSLLINRSAVVWMRGTETGIKAQYAGGAQ
jgi:hypothetical protein